MLCEVLGITKKEFHDLIIELVKRKRLSTKPENEKPIEVKSPHIDAVVTQEEYVESHYVRPHWARATIETLVRIFGVKEPVVALIDHDSKINLMSMASTRKESG